MTAWFGLAGSSVWGEGDRRSDVGLMIDLPAPRREANPATAKLKDRVANARHRQREGEPGCDARCGVCTPAGVRMCDPWSGGITRSSFGHRIWLLTPSALGTELKRLGGCGPIGD